MYQISTRRGKWKRFGAVELSHIAGVGKQSNSATLENYGSVEAEHTPYPVTQPLRS